MLRTCISNSWVINGWVKPLIDFFPIRFRAIYQWNAGSGLAPLANYLSTCLQTGTSHQLPAPVNIDSVIRYRHHALPISHYCKQPSGGAHLPAISAKCRATSIVYTRGICIEHHLISEFSICLMRNYKLHRFNLNHRLLLSFSIRTLIYFYVFFPGHSYN